MIIFGLNIILALSSNLYDTDFCRPTDLYDLLAEQAIESCTNRNSTGEELDIINHIISIEKEFNLPNSMKGMALAAACHESRFNPNALGDRKFSKNNKPKAVGLYLQDRDWETTEPLSSYITGFIGSISLLSNSSLIERNLPTPLALPFIPVSFIIDIVFNLEIESE